MATDDPTYLTELTDLLDDLSIDIRDLYRISKRNRSLIAEQISTTLARAKYLTDQLREST